VPFSALAAHGFQAVGGEDPYPVLRLELRPYAAAESEQPRTRPST